MRALTAVCVTFIPPAKKRMAQLLKTPGIQMFDSGQVNTTRSHSPSSQHQAPDVVTLNDEKNVFAGLADCVVYPPLFIDTPRGDRPPELEPDE